MRFQSHHASRLHHAIWATKGPQNDVSFSTSKCFEPLLSTNKLKRGKGMVGEDGRKERRRGIFQREENGKEHGLLGDVSVVLG